MAHERKRIRTVKAKRLSNFAKENLRYELEERLAAVPLGKFRVNELKPLSRLLKIDDDGPSDGDLHILEKALLRVRRIRIAA